MIDGAGKLMDAMRKPDGSYRTHAEMTREGPRRCATPATASTVGYSTPCDFNTMQGDPNPTHTYGLFMAEVEVDTKTGKTKVRQDDPARRLRAPGQQARRWTARCTAALPRASAWPCPRTSSTRPGTSPSRPRASPTSWTSPTTSSSNTPRRPVRPGPFGSSGCAELSLASGHVAIMNAIYDATGVRIFELPATPEKVLKGIQTLEKGGKLVPPAPYYLGSDMYERLEYLKQHPVVMPEKKLGTGP